MGTDPMTAADVAIAVVVLLILVNWIGGYLA